MFYVFGINLFCLGPLLQLAVKLRFRLMEPLAKRNFKVTIKLILLLQLIDKIKLKMWQCQEIVDKTVQLNKFF